VKEKLKKAHYLRQDVLRFVSGVFDDARTRDRYGLFGKDWGANRDWDDPELPSKSDYLSMWASNAFDLANLLHQVRQPLAIASGRTHTAAGMFAPSAHGLVNKLVVRLCWVMKEAARGAKPSWGYPYEAEFHHVIDAVDGDCSKDSGSGRPKHRLACCVARGLASLVRKHPRPDLFAAEITLRGPLLRPRAGKLP